MSTVRHVLTIGGSDSSGSAGIQADLKTLEARGIFGSTAITAITAQDSQQVYRVHWIPEADILAQMEVVLNDIGAEAVKTGFLARESVVKLVAETIHRYHLLNVVVDPVLVDGRGKPFVTPETISAYQSQLFPLAAIITPNVDEAALLTGMTLTTPDDLTAAAKKLHEMGARGVVVKGGHLSAGETIVNVFYDGTQMLQLTAPRLNIHNPHGVGCTFASAAAAELAKGHSLADAAAVAHRYLQAALSGSQTWRLGKGRLPVFHAVGRPPLFEDDHV